MVEALFEELSRLPQVKPSRWVTPGPALLPADLERILQELGKIL